MYYKDKSGHFTTKENNGGECPHNKYQNMSVDELKSITQKEYRQNTMCEKVRMPTMVVKIPDVDKEKIEEDKKRVAEFIEKKRRGERTQKKLKVSTISERAKKAVEALIGQPLNAKYHTLDIDEFKHIEKRHGANGVHDKTMSSIEDYTKIVDVLYNFDKVDFVYEKGGIKYSKFTDKNHKLAPLVSFTMSVGDKEKIVVEAITDGKSEDVRIISSYSYTKK